MRLVSAAHIILLWVWVCKVSLGSAQGAYDTEGSHVDGDSVFKLGGQSFCTGVVCRSQEDCCSGTVCITQESRETGTCAKLLAQPEGKLCVVQDSPAPCAVGLHCDPMHDDFLPLGMCMDPRRATRQLKAYFDACNRTLECDTTLQLCCRLHTPAREKLHKICSYFDDPVEDCIF